MGGAPLTHPDEIVADKPEPKPEPQAAQEEDALASSPLFDPEPTEPQDAPRAEEERASRLRWLHHANAAGRGAQQRAGA